jgi:hypothetical protein
MSCKLLLLSPNDKIMAKKANSENDNVRSIVNAYPENHGALGKRIELGARAHVTKNKSGAKYEFFSPTIELLIGIGNDSVARLIMDEDAWKDLKKGRKVNVDSLQTFKKKFL